SCLARCAAEIAISAACFPMAIAFWPPAIKISARRNSSSRNLREDSSKRSQTISTRFPNVSSASRRSSPSSSIVWRSQRTKTACDPSCWNPSSFKASSISRGAREGSLEPLVLQDQVERPARRLEDVDDVPQVFHVGSDHVNCERLNAGSRAELR